MNKNDNNLKFSIKNYFNGLEDKYELNGGNNNFKFKEIEVFQLS